MGEGTMRTNRVTSMPSQNNNFTLFHCEARHLSVVLGLVLGLGNCAVGLATETAQPPDMIALVVSPQSAVRGKKLQVSITPKDQKSCEELKKQLDDKEKGTLLVEPLSGSGVNVTEANVMYPCLILAEISIDADAPADIVQLVLKKELEGKEPKKKVPLARADFLVKAFQAGPIPPGLPPTVDVLWGIVAERVVRANFGHWISKKFYCIEVVIGNDSGYSLQIASVGFDVKDATHKIPTNGYHITRASLENGRVYSARTLVLGVITALSQMMTGSIPFFHNPNHKNNFQTLTNIVSGPAEVAAGLIPDLTLQQLNRLDDQMLRDGLIVPNNTQVRSVVFISKEEVLTYVSKAVPTTTPGGIKDKTECAFPTKGGCKLRASVDTISTALGKLVLIGDEISYQNRVRVEANPPEGVPAPSQLQLKYKDNQAPEAPKQGEGPKEVAIVITGKHLEKAMLTVPEGSDKLHIKDFNLAKDNSEIDATITIDEGINPGRYPLTVKTPGGSDTVNFEVASRQGPSDLLLKYKDLEEKEKPQAPEKGAGSKDVAIIITGKHLEGAMLAGPKGTDKLHVKDPSLSKDNSEIDATVTIDEGIDPTQYPLTVTTPRGSATVNFEVVKRSK